MNQISAAVDAFISQAPLVMTAYDIHELTNKILSEILLPRAKCAVKGAKDVDNAITSIKSQMIVLDEHKRYLFEERNLDQSISRFPNEIFLQIFRHLTPSFDTTYEVGARWLSFTHVCRRWRDMARHDPSLWTHPWFLRPRVAGLMISLAKDQPLHVSISDDSFSIGDHFLSTAISLISKQVKTIETLNIEIGKHAYSAMKKLLSKFPGGDASSLKCLFASCSHFPNPARNDSVLHPPIHAPRLQRATLKDIIFPFEMSSLQSLVHLEIVVHRRNPMCRISISKLLQLLNSAPCLQVLVIKAALNRSPSFGTELEVTRGRSNSLRSLTLHHSVRTVLRLFQRLQLPSLSSLSIEPSEGKETPHLFDIEALYQELERLIAESLCPTIRHMQIDMGSPLEFKLWLSSYWQAPLPDSPALDVKYTMRLDSNIDLVSMLQLAQNTMACLANVSHVAVLDDTDGTTHGLWATLGTLPALTDVLMERGCAQDLVSALASAPILNGPRREALSAQQNRDRFAHLSTIIFKDSVFKQENQPDTLLNTCKTALVYRRGTGMPLRRLVFLNCDLPMEWIEELRIALSGVDVGVLS